MAYYYNGWMISDLHKEEEISEEEIRRIMCGMRLLDDETRNYWYNQYKELFHRFKILEEDKRNLAAIDYVSSKHNLDTCLLEYNTQLLSILPINKTGITPDVIYQFWKRGKYV